MTKWTLFFVFLSYLFFSASGQSRNTENVGIGEVSIIEFDAYGNAWTGSLGGGVTVYNSASGQSSYYNSSTVPQFKSDTITTILACLVNGTEYIFIGTTNGLISFVNNTWDTVAHFPTPYVSGLALPPSDTLWVFTATGGVALYDYTGHNFFGIMNAGNSVLPTNLISTAQFGNEACGNIIFGTATNGVYITDNNGVSYIHIDSSATAAQLVDNRITSIYGKNDCSAVLVGTQAGYSFCPPGLNCLNFTTSRGLPQNYITSISEDCGGGIWVGTKDSGIAIYNPHVDMLTHLWNIDTLVGYNSTESTLVQARDSMFYGMISAAAYNVTGGGTIFRYNPFNGILATLFLFDTLSSPIGNLIQNDSGVFIGVIAANSNGASIFTFDPVADTITTVVQFTYLSSVTGDNPLWGMNVHEGTPWYGAMCQGGANNFGTIFQFNPINYSFVKLYDLQAADVPAGASTFGPTGQLLKASNGLLYGLAGDQNGGSLSTLYQFNTGNNSYTTVYTFDSLTIPSGDIVQAGDGMIYGWASYDSGGAFISNSIFQFDPNANALSIVPIPPTCNGAYISDFIVADNGLLYGTLDLGNANNAIIQFNPYNKSLIKLVDLDSTGIPYVSDLFQAKSGLMWGYTAPFEGDSGYVFDFNPGASAFHTITTANGLPSNQITFIAFPVDTCTGESLVATADGSITRLDTSGTVLQIFTGVHETLSGLQGVYVFPQPASGTVKFVIPGETKNGILQITDLYGRPVLSLPANQNPVLTADISGLASGIYFYSLYNNANTCFSGKMEVYH